MLIDGKDKCSCSNTSCPRHSDCKACMKYHAQSNSKTGCERAGTQKKAEKGK